MSEAFGFHHIFVPGPGPAPWPCALLLHGTGGDENDLLQLGQRLAPNSAILSPRGKVSENGMARWFRRFAEGVFDVEDVKRRANELADFVDAASRAYGVDRGRITAIGYSNGANIAAALMLLRPEILAAAVLFRAMLPVQPDTEPDLTLRQALICAGRSDPYAPQPSVEALERALVRAGAAVQVRWVDAGHGLLPGEIDAAAKWLQTTQHA